MWFRSLTTLRGTRASHYTARRGHVIKTSSRSLYLPVRLDLLQHKMASGGEQSAEVVSKIAKNVVQNFRTKEVRVQAAISSLVASPIHPKLHSKTLYPLLQNPLPFPLLPFLLPGGSHGDTVGRQHCGDYVSSSVWMTFLSAGGCEDQPSPADIGRS